MRYEHVFNILEELAISPVNLASVWWIWWMCCPPPKEEEVTAYLKAFSF